MKLIPTVEYSVKSWAFILYFVCEYRLFCADQSPALLHLIAVTSAPSIQSQCCPRGPLRTPSPCAWGRTPTQLWKQLCHLTGLCARSQQLVGTCAPGKGCEQSLGGGGGAAWGPWGPHCPLPSAFPTLLPLQ